MAELGTLMHQRIGSDERLTPASSRDSSRSGLPSTDGRSYNPDSSRSRGSFLGAGFLSVRECALCVCAEFVRSDHN